MRATADMPGVAIVGADGAGKSTICRLLIEKSDLPLKYIYMGVNLEASSVMLPSTRLLLLYKKLRGRRPDATFRMSARRQSTANGLRQSAKSFIRLLYWVSEEWYRQLIAWWHQKRGYTTIFDRHFYADYFAYDIEPNGAELPLANRVHGYMLEKLYPKPELIVLLEAPPEILYSRKQEGTLEFLKERQDQYRKIRTHVERFEIVDATLPPDEVVRRVDALIRQHVGNHQQRTA